MIITDVFLGYAGFLIKTREVSALLHFTKTRILKLHDKRARNVEIVSTESNPFVNYRPEDKKISFRYHPFIEWSTLTGKSSYILDYFGFRNDEDIYFENKDLGFILIVITGGSEAAGVSHQTSIAQTLEKILNEKYADKQKFKVMNLAMMGYTISNEINAYVNLVYHLKPEFVISYSGWNDLLYGMMVPYNFKKLGLYYYRAQETWLPRLYNLKEYVGHPGFVFNEKGIEIVVDRYLKNVEKYRNIVTSNGGSLIVGIQGYNKDLVFDTKSSDIVHIPERLVEVFGCSKTNILYEKIYHLYQELTKKAVELGYIDFTRIENLKCLDTVHSTDESSVIIANIFAEEILSELHEKRKWE